MLDTNIASALIRDPSGPAAQRARAVATDIAVGIIVAAELRYGCIKKGSAPLQRRVEQFLATVPVLPWAAPADARYGSIRATLEQEGAPIGGNDLLIAAHALALDAVLVTANVREFSRIPDLIVENWLAETPDVPRSKPSAR